MEIRMTKAETKVYKCYISNTDDTHYYWYFKNNSAYPYGNENTLKLPAKNISDLDRVANVDLYSITDTSAHIIFDHNVHIYAVRDRFFDLEEDINAD